MIPYSEIESVTLDVGNTLVAPDFEWVAAELQRLGVDCDAESVRRAEAAARPGFRPGGRANDESGLQRVFRRYMEGVLVRLHELGALLPEPAADLAARLVPILDGPENRQRLWSVVMPGAPDALNLMRGLGLRLVAVSNSDGTAEQILARLDLRGFLDGVLDSQRVGYEKPDPRIFRLAIEAAETRPDRILHVGDQYEADVEGARSAGLHAILLDPFGDWATVDCETAPDVLTVARRLGSAQHD